MKTDIKTAHITRRKKSQNFNSKRFQRKMARISKPRKSLLVRIFPRKYNNFWWKGTHNGVFGPGGHTHWEFKSGNLALVIALLTFIAFIAYVIVN